MPESDIDIIIDAADTIERRIDPEARVALDLIRAQLDSDQA